MATNTLPAVAPSGDTAPAPELRIEMFPDDIARYIGTAAQLQAEGLIPDSFEWPRAAAGKQWDAHGFRYWLQRARPEGHKGPMSSWLEVDNWAITCRVAGRDYRWTTRRRLERQAEELRAAYHRETAAGAREWEARFKRHSAALNDKRFQAFKLLVPGLVPPKRGRRSKAAAGTP